MAGDGHQVAAKSGHRRRKSRVAEYVEYVLARIGIVLIGALPPRLSCRLARTLGSLAFLILRKRRAIAVRNILAAGVADTPASAKRIAKESFQSFALTVAESFLFHRVGEDLECEIDPEAEKAMRETNCGFICSSGHLGNWEVGAQFLTRYRPVTGIARRMGNARVQRLMDSRGMRKDFETIDKHSGRPMDIVRALKRNRALAILSDQHASVDGAVVIDFFGRKAATYSTPVVIQRLTGAPIVFAYAIRTGFMRFRVHIEGPIFYDIPKDAKDEAVANATQDLASRLEAAIRKYPGQYLWAHRRWKYAERHTASASHG